MQTRREAFQTAHPEAFLLDGDDLPGLGEYLASRGWLDADEDLRSAEKPGEGNMNYTLRVTTSRRSVILKQARPWVEKYEQIEAPWDRGLVEGEFYEAIGQHAELRSRMPKLLGLDPTSRTLLLEDLGGGADFTSMYQGEALAVSDLDELVAYLVRLHDAFAGTEQGGRLTNRAMRDLNHLHMFQFPLQPANGLDLDGLTMGLSAVAQALQANTAYVTAVERLGQEYLRDEGSLAHGDFFPGSWLHTPTGPRVIDPEFCFLGPPEFDVGVMMAHLELSNQEPALARRLLREYLVSPPQGWSQTRQARAFQFAGVEIMRRLIGVAQLPLSYGITRKRELLALSELLVLSPDPARLA